MSTAVSRIAVGEYVTAVRAELDDLSPDEIEELTGGLEADLGDALASEGDADPAQRFGTPQAYAAELRAAAGLAPRAVSGGGRRGVRNTVGDWHETLRRQAWWGPTTTYLVSLRPAWWLARALFIAAGAAVFLGLGFAVCFVLAVLLIAVSLPAGRRAWQHRGVLPRLGVAVLNGVAVLVLVIGFFAVFARGGGSSQSVVYEPAPDSIGTGLTTEDGYSIANIFPYDKDGKPLNDVQLYDDRGRPLNASKSYVDSDGRTVDYAPGVDSNGDQRWNAYPLRERDPYDEGEIDPITGEPQTAPTGPPHDAARPDPTQAPLVSLPTTSASASATPTPMPTK